MYRIIYYGIYVMLFLFLICIPLAYCIKKGEFIRGFFFTWITWTIVWFVYGFCLPAFCVIIEEVTGKPCDISCVTMFLGIFFGWIPGLIFGAIFRRIPVTETKISDTLGGKNGADI